MKQLYQFSHFKFNGYHLYKSLTRDDFLLKYQRIILKSVIFDQIQFSSLRTVYLRMTIEGDQRTYKLNNYSITINPICEKKLQIKVIDTNLKIEFSQKELTLDKIGTLTLLLALEGTRKQIQITYNHKKQAQFEILQLKVSVSSAFLRTFQESIFIKKFRDVTQMQVLDSKMKSLAQKLGTFKQKVGVQTEKFYSYNPEEQHFTDANYVSVASIRLKKGRYLLTFTFQLKATSQWLYLYLDNTQEIIQKGGFYTPITTQYIPVTIRTVKTISEQRDLKFTTYCASSYPVFLRNRLITAQVLSD